MQAFGVIMKSETITLLLLGCISCGVNACTYGDIRISGVSSETILAGRVDLCYESEESISEWRVICQQNWDRKDAMVVCREFGFPAEGAQFCINSCLGRNDTLKGINNFECSGSETRIVDCQPSPNPLSGMCFETIGVICSSTIFDVLNTSLLFPTTSAAIPETTTIDTHNTQEDQQASPGISAGVDGSTAAEATLGGVVVVLLIILLGLVIGLVWTCRKNKKLQSSRYSTE